MSLASYPANLPRPLLDGYGLARQGEFLRSTLDTGRAAQRERFKAVPTELTATFRLTASEAQQLETFIESSLHGGVAPFLLDVLIPAGAVSHQVRFISDPREDCKPLDPMRWEYRAQIEVRRLQTLTEEQTATALVAPNTIEDFVTGVDDAVRSYQD